MYSPETLAEIEQLRAQLPLTTDQEARRAIMKRAVILIKSGRSAAATSSAVARARKAKDVVLNANDLLADLEGGLE